MGERDRYKGNNVIGREIERKREWQGEGREGDIEREGKWVEEIERGSEWEKTNGRKTLKLKEWGISENTGIINIWRAT